MAKKLNKKVAIIGIVLLVLIIVGGIGMLAALKIRRNPDRALKLAHKALESGDYLEAETQFGRSYGLGKTDEYKIDRLFELAEFHLIQDDQHQAEWNKAMGCWNKIASIDPGNMKARKALLDFYYQAAESGDTGSWRYVKENTTEMLGALKTVGTEPDVFLLTAHSKALLSVAMRGETTDRRTPLEESINILNDLIERQPENEELYQLLAQAENVNGELNALAGIIDAQEKSQQKALEILEEGVENSKDKATAVANLMVYRMQQTANDPNTIEAVRVEIDDFTKQVQSNDKLWSVISMAYELSGKMSAEAELNRSIEAIRKASEQEPENFEYILRKAKLLYRKGNTFNDPAAIEDALQVAEDALSMQQVQDVPGPTRSRNVRYRFALNSFLADLYLEKALAARSADNTSAAEEQTQKAQERVDEIISVLGSTENPTAQKYEGLIAMAQGQEGRAIRLLYKAYEQERALDKEGEASNVDSRVCIALAKAAEQKNQPGLQSEFLGTALRSRDRAISQNPGLLLDYADILNRLRNARGWAQVVKQLAENYQTRFGANDQSRRLLMEATLAMRQIDQAEELLDSFDNSPALKLRYELAIILRKIGQVRSEITQAEKETTEPAPEQQQRLDDLYRERNSLVENLLQSYPKEMSSARLGSICRNLIQNDQTDRAIDYLNTYLADTPDVLGLIQLRLLAQQENPSGMSEEQLFDLREEAIRSLEDSKQRVLLLTELYRSQDEYEKASRTLETLDSDDSDVITTSFDIAIGQKDLQKAQALQQIIRKENIDGCDGALAAARIEIVKENYELALRRLDECISLSPLSSHTHFIKSQVQRQLEDIDGAVESAKTTIRMNPQSGLYARNLASLVFARNSELGNKVTVEQQREAEQAIAFAMTLNPTDWQLQSVYAESIQIQAPDQALAIRQRLLEAYPTAANAMMLGNMALRIAGSEWDAAKKTGLMELAGTAYQKGIEIAPDDEALRQAYADYLNRTQQGQKAMELLGDDDNLLWKFYLRNGQFEQAKTILKELLQNKSDDPLLVQGLVLASQGQGNREDVKQYLDLLSGLDETKETELWILQKYLDNGFTAEAQVKLESLKERYPDESAALLVEAWIQMGNGYLDEALALANRYMETNINNPGAWRLRGRIYRLLNQSQKAIDDLLRSKSLQETPEVLIELATVYIETNQTTAAIGTLTPSMDDPKTPLRIRLMLEELYKKNNRVNDLEKFYASMIKNYPDSPYWYLRAGMFLLERKDFTESENLLQKALDMSAESGMPNLTALDYYLECLYQSGQYDKVVGVGSGYIDGNLAHVAYGHIAQSQLKSGQPQRAVESFHRALDKVGANQNLLESIARIVISSAGEEILNQWIDKQFAEDPDSLPAHLLSSTLAQMKGSYNSAIEHIDQCMKKVDSDSRQWLGYALNKSNLLLMAYSKTGDKDYFSRAADLLKAILQIQPNNASVLNNLAYLLVDNDQQLDMALEYSLKAHQREPGNAVYLDTFAYAQCKNGQYEQAEQNLIRALQMYEISGQTVPWDLYEHFGMAKEGLGKNAEAIGMYQKALEASEQIPESDRQQLQEAIKRLQQT